MEQQQVQFNLKTNVNNFLKEELFESCKKNKQFDFEAGMFMLVVDEASCSTLNSFVQYTDLMEKGIAGIERLELKRKQFENMHAIYFISPTRESIDLINADFEGKKKRQYGFIHIVFSNTVADDLLDYLVGKKAILDLIVNVKQVNLDFKGVDETTFSLNMKGVLPVLYSDKRVDERDQMIDAITSKLSTVLTSLKDYWNVQVLYNNDDGIKNSAAKKIALGLASKIQGSLSDRKKPVSKPAPVSFIIMDRTKDMLSPLKHDLFYNSLIVDLLQIEGNQYEHEVINEKQIKSIKISKLDENDSIWLEHRCYPFLKALTLIVTKFNDFLKNNSAAKMQQGKIEDLNIEKMGEIIREMPQYQDLLGEYTFHINMLEKAGDIFKRRKIAELADTEGILASGVDKNWKDKKIKNSGILNNFQYHVDIDRLGLMMAMSEFCDPSVSKQMPKNLTKEGYQCYEALGEIGVQDNSQQLPQKELEVETDNKFSDLDRSMSYVTECVRQLKKGKETSQFSSIVLPKGEDFPSIRVKAGKSIGKSLGGKKKKDSSAPIIIVFAVGGLSYNEIRELRSLEKLKGYGGHVTLMGGTSLLTPHSFLEELQRVHGPLQKDIEAEQAKQMKINPPKEAQKEGETTESQLAKDGNGVELTKSESGGDTETQNA